MTRQIVTIDGPAGSGKTTVSRQLAMKLNWIYVDTGALYRGVALGIRQSGVDWKDPAALKRFLEQVRLDLVMNHGELILLSDGHDISGLIRTPEISMLASAVSAVPEVRRALLGIQQEIARQHDAVFEGRDMGTVVFPEAQYKFFLYADLKTRAIRRFNEFQNSGQTLDDVQSQMEKRDSNDTNRDEAPLKPAADAILIDSTLMEPDDVVEKLYGIIRQMP